MTQGGRIKRDCLLFLSYRPSRSTTQWNEPIGKVCEIKQKGANQRAKKARHPVIIKTKESYKILECFEKEEKLICLNIKSHHPPNVITT